MRTAIFISGALIADSINIQGSIYNSNTMGFLSGLFLIFFTMDVIEFFHNLRKSKNVSK